jgi:hypothetical protein
MPSIALTWATGSGFGLRLKVIGRELIHIPIAEEDDAAAIPTVAPVGASLGDEFLPPEAQAAIAATTGSQTHPGFIDEHVKSSSLARRQTLRPRFPVKIFPGHRIRIRRQPSPSESFPLRLRKRVPHLPPLAITPLFRNQAPSSRNRRSQNTSPKRKRSRLKRSSRISTLS